MIALVLFACAGEAPPAEVLEVVVAPAPVAVTVQLNWFPEPEFGGIYEAKEAGTYDKAGLDVQILAGGAGTPVLQQVATGRSTFGLTTADEVLLARAQGADVVAVFATYQKHPACIMTHRKRGVTDLSELKGGTLALEDGIPFAQWLSKKFAFEGVTRVPYSGGVAGFLLDENYAQQGYVTSEPILAKKQGADPVCLMVADTGYNPYANVVVTSGAEIKDHPDVVKRFVEATQAGWDAYLVDGTRANAKIATLNTAVDAAALQEMWHTQQMLVKGGAAEKGGVGVMEEARWTELAAQLLEIGALSAPADAKAAFTNEFLPTR